MQIKFTDNNDSEVLLYVEWPKIHENFLEPAVIIHFVRLIASAGKMKANIADFINEPKTNMYVNK